MSVCMFTATCAEQFSLCAIRACSFSFLPTIQPSKRSKPSKLDDSLTAAAEAHDEDEAPTRRVMFIDTNE